MIFDKFADELMATDAGPKNKTWLMRVNGKFDLQSQAIIRARPGHRLICYGYVIDCAGDGSLGVRMSCEWLHGRLDVVSDNISQRGELTCPLPMPVMARMIQFDICPSSADLPIEVRCMVTHEPILDVVEKIAEQEKPASEVSMASLDLYDEISWWKSTHKLAREMRPNTPLAFEERLIAEIDRLNRLLAVIRETLDDDE